MTEDFPRADLRLSDTTQDLMYVPELPRFTEQTLGSAVMGVTGLAIVPQEQEVPKSESEQLRSAIHERVESAKRSVEFETTPEVGGAIEGFYTDHMTLQAAISAVVRGDYASDVFTLIETSEDMKPWERQMGAQPAYNDAYKKGGHPLEAPNANIYTLRISQEVRRLRALETVQDTDRIRILRLCGQAVNALYTESSVGVSTLSNDEIDATTSLADAIYQEAKPLDQQYYGYSGSFQYTEAKYVRGNIEAAQKQFWADTRRAGQLLFHGTIRVGGINMRGLMSRNEQLRQTGEMQNLTALNFDGDTMHSVVPHFSEFYGLGQYADGDHRGTAVVPLIRVIEQAPFARDAHFGAARLKDPTSLEKIPTPTLDIPIDQSGGGQPDYPGSRGIDRVFFASPDENSDLLPDQYAVSLFKKAGKPGSYIVDYTGHDPYADERVFAQDGLGAGDGFPERITIKRPVDYGSIVPFEQRKETAGAVIKQVQQEYLDAFDRYGVVLPLRRGVFVQAFENVPTDMTKGRPRARVYNKYTPGTGRAI